MRFIIAICVLFLSALSSQADTCDDTLSNCPSYKSNCENFLITKYCPKTCGACPSGPCTTNNSGCDHLCREVNDTALCSCLPGFRLLDDSKTCADINECTEGPNPCFLASPGFCINNVGSYSCQRYSCSEPGYMNYYRSGQCCRFRNSTCGITESIRANIAAYNSSSRRSGEYSRVLGGADAALTAWPWQAQILFQGGAHCGATLISNQWLISAAHCFAGNSFTQMIVYVGQIRSATLLDVDRSRRQQRRISQVIFHEDYSNLYNNDIALVQLDEPVEINDIVNPICLPCGEIPKVGDKCWVTGFGRTEHGPEISETLQEVDVPIVDHKACKEAYDGLFPINKETMFCAGYPEGGKDACLGDSGGPLACQRADSCDWYLAGVTSFGRGCGLPGYYGVYVNVINYETWIRENLGNDFASCAVQYNPCRGMVNHDDECYEKLDVCEKYPFYMTAKCRLACCQAQNNEIPADVCRDDPEVEPFCETYKSFCNNPIFGKYMEKKCRKTCDFC